MKAYKYTSEQDAIDAVELCDKHYKIPSSEDSTTIHWTNYYSHEDFWYIVYDESLNIVLGNPQEIEINDSI